MEQIVLCKVSLEYFYSIYCALVKNSNSSNNNSYKPKKSMVRQDCIFLSTLYTGDIVMSRNKIHHFAECFLTLVPALLVNGGTMLYDLFSTVIARVSELTTVIERVSELISGGHQQFNDCFARSYAR